jgi:hypothetical protein
LLNAHKACVTSRWISMRFFCSLFMPVGSDHCQMHGRWNAVTVRRRNQETWREEKYHLYILY